MCLFLPNSHFLRREKEISSEDDYEMTHFELDPSPSWVTNEIGKKDDGREFLSPRKERSKGVFLLKDFWINMHVN